jgi:hypothetical protein
LKDPFYVGPFNDLRAKKLIAHYDAHPRTKGKLMLVDDEMLPWLLHEGSSIERGPHLDSRDMPSDLSYEISGYFNGEGKGRLMRQTEGYRDLASRNNTEKKILAHVELSRIYEKFKQGCGSNPNICFCETQHSDDTNMVECTFRHCLHQNFHRNCVKGLGVDKVSSWYCPDCERVMGRMARMVLGEVKFMSEGRPALIPTALDLLTGACVLEDFVTEGWPHLDDDEFDLEAEVRIVVEGLLKSQTKARCLASDDVN